MRPLPRLARIAAACALAPLAAACSVVRISAGSPLRADPCVALAEGHTTRAEVLAAFGPPTRIARRLDGEIFSYDYVRKWSRTLTIADPIATGIRLLTYTTSEESSDRLVVLFDPSGVVSGFGLRRIDGAQPAAAADAGPRSADRCEPAAAGAVATP